MRRGKEEQKERRTSTVSLINWESLFEQRLGLATAAISANNGRSEAEKSRVSGRAVAHGDTDRSRSPRFFFSLDSKTTTTTTNEHRGYKIEEC